MPSLLSPAQQAQFAADGFVIVRGMFDPAETALLRTAMEQDPEVSSHLIDRLDAQGAATRIALWNRAGDSVYGMAARCARMVDARSTTSNPSSPRRSRSSAVPGSGTRTTATGTTTAACSPTWPAV